MEQKNLPLTQIVTLMTWYNSFNLQTGDGHSGEKRP